MLDPITILVLAAGDPGVVVEPPPHDLVIAADSGLDLAESLGLSVDLVIGDMDSVSAKALHRAESAAIDVERHPRAKDRTDLELAMSEAVARGASAIHVMVGAGGRLDHAAANLAVMASPEWGDVAVSGTVGESSVWVARRELQLMLPVGETLSLLPIGGPALGVTTSGLEWQLDGEDLGPYSARGVSNVVVATPVIIRVASGVLLAVNSPMRPTDHGAAPD